jgi:conjugal transfer pilus assembly protein TraV
VICTSVSGIYANSLDEALPGQQQPKPQDKSSQDAGSKDSKDGATMPPPGSFSPRDLATPNSGDPIRMAPLVLRVWIAPWEDTDGDLHDQHYLYTVVHQGKWLIETNQQQIRDAYKPVFPLRGKDKPEEERPVADDAMPGVSGQRGGNP